MGILEVDGGWRVFLVLAVGGLSYTHLLFFDLDGLEGWKVLVWYGILV